jgi:hypothetical protein
MRVLMRRAWALLIVLPLVLTMALPVEACREARTHHFKGHISVEVTYFPGSDPFTGEKCPYHEVGILTYGEGNGRFSPLGRVHVTTQHCAPNAFEGEDVTGMMTLTTKNGDTLVLQYVGAAYITGFDPEGPDEVTGKYTVKVLGDESTGRFEGARGRGKLTVVLTPETFEDLVWPGDFWLKGTIRY